MLPSSTRRSLPMTLLKARELVMRRFRPMLQSHDLTEQQWRVLRVLAETGPLDAREAADRASILGPSLTRIIKSLESRDLITRGRAENDGRRAELVITASGLAIIEALGEERRAIYAALDATHSKERLARLLDDLEAFIAAEYAAHDGDASSEMGADD